MVVAVSTVKKPATSGLNIKVDRTTPLGNPFWMATENQRDIVCERYERHFATQVKVPGPFRNEVIRIFRLARTQNITLLCHCAPLRCHADTIRDFLNKHLENQ